MKICIIGCSGHFAAALQHGLARGLCAVQAASAAGDGENTFPLEAMANVWRAGRMCIAKTSGDGSFGLGFPAGCLEHIGKGIGRAPSVGLQMPWRSVLSGLIYWLNGSMGCMFRIEKSMCCVCSEVA